MTRPSDQTQPGGGAQPGGIAERGHPAERGKPDEGTGTHAASRLGLALFAIYFAFYLGFVLISAFACDWFEIILPGGLNLAVVYGFGLIILALVLAMIYGGVRQQQSH